MTEGVILSELDRQMLIAQILKAPLGSTFSLANPKKRRSPTMRQASHLWFKMVSIDLNNAGYDMKKVLKPTFDISWSEDGYMAKNYLWRPVQEAVTGHESTTQPTNAQYMEIYENVNRRLPVHTPWPCR